jgi:hypothetical protein
LYVLCSIAAILACTSVPAVESTAGN